MTLAPDTRGWPKGKTPGKVTNEVVTVFDAVQVNTIPADAQNLLAYVDGEWPTLQWCISMFPNATIKTVTVNGSTPNADICDMEFGDTTAIQAAQWALDAIHNGRPAWNPPSIYCQSANAWEVTEACQSLGLTFGDMTCDVCYYMAWWNDEAVVYEGTVAHQYYRASELTYDVSKALSAWMFPEPPPPPYRDRGEGMFVRYTGPTNSKYENGLCCECSGGVATPLRSGWPLVEETYGSYFIVIEDPNGEVLNNYTMK